MFGSQGDTIFLFWVSSKKSLGTPDIRHSLKGRVGNVVEMQFVIFA